jgi:hypothetical protein
VLFVTSDDTADQLDKSTTKKAKSNLVRLHEEADDDKDGGLGLCCAICLCPYENGDQICWSNNKSCLHPFHAACGIAWLAKHEECPMCRAEYLVEPETDKDNTIIEEEKSAREVPNESTPGSAEVEQNATVAADETVSSSPLGGGAEGETV